MFREEYGREPLPGHPHPRAEATKTLEAVAARLGVPAPRLAEALGLPGLAPRMLVDFTGTGFYEGRCAACKKALEPGAAEWRRVVHSELEVEGDGSFWELELMPSEAVYGGLRPFCRGCAPEDAEFEG